MPPALSRILTRAPSTLHAHIPARTLSPRTLQRFTHQRIPFITARSVASSVSGKPGSQTLPHAYTNIKEETGNSAKDLAKTIAGNIGGQNHPAETVGPINDTFVGITSAIAANVPRHVLTMGLAGALPYLGTSISTVYLARQAGLAASGITTGVDPSTAIALLNTCMTIQVTYGAVLISFAGALHWGLEFAAYNGQKGYPRLLLGAAPVVLAWSSLALDPAMALVAQWVTYTGLWYGDMKATGAGWTPKWYSQYRFYLSMLVGTCIIGTLAGTSYLGPSPGHDATHHSLERIRATRRLTHGDMATQVSGPLEAVAADVEDEGYVKIVKRQEDEGEGEAEGKSEGKDSAEKK